MVAFLEVSAVGGAEDEAVEDPRADQPPSDSQCRFIFQFLTSKLIQNNSYLWLILPDTVSPGRVEVPGDALPDEGAVGVPHGVVHRGPRG